MSETELLLDKLKNKQKPNNKKEFIVRPMVLDSENIGENMNSPILEKDSESGPESEYNVGNKPKPNKIKIIDKRNNTPINTKFSDFLKTRKIGFQKQEQQEQQEQDAEKRENPIDNLDIINEQGEQGEQQQEIPIPKPIKKRKIRIVQDKDKDNLDVNVLKDAEKNEKNENEDSDARPEEEEKEKETQQQEPPGKKGKKEKTPRIISKKNIQNIIIQGTKIGDRLPLPSEKFIYRASSYYMNNRQLSIEKLNKLFQPYSQEILDNIENITCDTRSSSVDFDLLTHQKIVRDYLNLYTPYRGLLLYHGLGSGKTCTSIAIAEGMKTDKRIFIMTPASLKMNFFGELKKCGDHIFKKNQFWEFISVTGQPTYVDILSSALSLDKTFIQTNRGAWLVNIKKPANFAELSTSDQKAIDAQLNEMIRSKYVDINYNGLNKGKMDELTDHSKINPFDNSVVVIDEAHNFVSRIVNKIKKKNTISNRLYEYLMSAVNAKIVLLTGTPIINYPNEIGILYNILRGYIKTWTFPLQVKTSQKINRDSILEMFDNANFQSFDYVEYTGNTLTITRNPFGFVNTKKRTTKSSNNEIVPVPKQRQVEAKVLPREPDQKQKDKEQKDKEQKDKEQKDKEQKDKEQKDKEQKDKEQKDKKVESEAPIKIKRKYTRKVKNTDPDTDKPDSEKNPEKTVKKNTTVKRKIKIIGSEPEPLPFVETNPTRDESGDLHREIYNEANGQHVAGLDTNTTYGGVNEFDTYNGVKLDDTGNMTDADFMKTILRILKSNDIDVAEGAITIVNHKSLPDDSDSFLNIFVDKDTVRMKNENLFKKRILGLTSYFRSAQEKLLPTFVKNDKDEIFHIIECEMSDYQFAEYTAIRHEEADREKKSARNARKPKNANAEELYNISSTYRIFSRACCNFVFPNPPGRPMPEKKGVNGDEDINETELDAVPSSLLQESEFVDEDELREDETRESEKPVVDYKQKIQLAMQFLKDNATEYLLPEGLATYSPKFMQLLENLQDTDNEGLHLIYSQFRTIEGIGILKLILEANGFVHFKIKRLSNGEWELDMDSNEDPDKPRFLLYTGTETPEEKEILRNIYNSQWETVPASIVAELKKIADNNFMGEIVKIMMITSSGAEGINLKNTRFVHIVEPYWHMVRIEQVVGRARRICSHQDLPEALRTVKVFLYLATLSESQSTGEKNKELVIRDVSKLDKKTPFTTDESLYETSRIKDNINQQLLKAVKESAIDCSLYSKNGDENLVCYGYGKVKSNTFGSYPSLSQDENQKDELNVKKEKMQLVKATIRGKIYAVEKKTGNVYDFASYERAKTNGENLTFLGKIDEREASGINTRATE
jgi:hypothetical protein